MRHTRHYVDEVLGDTPIRTVREIPVNEIEPPTDEEPLDEFETFEHSIRRHGVLEPLIVGRSGARSGAQYRVIAGMRRLRAAHKLGLGTVPCLVHEGDAEKLNDLREAAMQRLTPIPPPSPEPDPEPPAADLLAPEPSLLEPEVDQSDRLRWAVLGDLASIELLHAKTLAAAQEIVTTAHNVERAPVDCGSLVADAIAVVATEARLRSVRLEINISGADAGVSLDAAMCRTALTGMLQALLALAPREGTTLAIHAQVTAVRPAFIVQCALKEGEKDLSTELTYTRPGRFFDPEWRDHPCGPAGAQMLAAMAKTARLHGGRADIQPRPSKGCAAIFVLPRPLTDV